MSKSPPDAEATPEIRTAMVLCDRLLALVPGPITGQSSATEPRALDNWDVVAPAMLFSAASNLLSLRYLATAPAPRREQDAWVLLRRLYEHAVDFAWIAVAPATNAKQWAADDKSYRLKIDDDMKKLGAPGLDAAARAAFETYVKQHGKMPSLLDRTLVADTHWAAKIAGHGTFPTAPPPQGQRGAAAQGGSWSLRGLYMLIYRQGSATAHPTPRSLEAYANVMPSGRYDIGLRSNQKLDRFAYTFAPLVYATMLFVAEHVLGFPKADDVTAVFAM